MLDLSDVERVEVSHDGQPVLVGFPFSQNGLARQVSVQDLWEALPTAIDAIPTLATVAFSRWDKMYFLSPGKAAIRPIVRMHLRRGIIHCPAQTADRGYLLQHSGAHVCTYHPGRPEIVRVVEVVQRFQVLCRLLTITREISAKDILDVMEPDNATRYTGL